MKLHRNWTVWEQMKPIKMHIYPHENSLWCIFMLFVHTIYSQTYSCSLFFLVNSNTWWLLKIDCHINQFVCLPLFGMVLNRPFHSVLSCQAFDLEWGWKGPCCDRDQYLVSIITRQFTFEKQQCLWHNKVTLSFTPVKRLSNQV